MTKKELIAGIRKNIIDENLETYRQLFEGTKLEDTSDTYWREGLKFYHGLDNQSKDTFYKIIKQIMVDSLSMRIPLNPDTQSRRNRTVSPRESGHPVQ